MPGPLAELFRRVAALQQRTGIEEGPLSSKLFGNASRLSRLRAAGANPGVLTVERALQRLAELEVEAGLSAPPPPSEATP